MSTTVAPTTVAPGWVGENKGAGPWAFVEQKNKWGYLNNQLWSSKQDSQEFCDELGNQYPLDPPTHDPCGHWHKGKIVVSVPIYESFWQQSVDVLKDSRLYGLGAIGTTTDNYIVQIYDFDGNVIQGYFWDTPDIKSDYPGTTRIENISGLVKAFYANHEMDGATGERSVYMHTLDVSGSYTRSEFYTDVYIDGNNWNEMYFNSSDKTFAVSSTGIVVTVINVRERVAGVLGFRTVTRRSLDQGVTWETAVSIPTKQFGSKPYIEVDSSDNFYITTSDIETPAKPFRLWKSTDYGASWVEIVTVPTTPTSVNTYMNFDISGEKLYIAGSVLDGTRKNYVWYSNNSGLTWSRGNPTIVTDAYCDDTFIAANNDVVVMALTGVLTTTTFIVRSTDNGATWTPIGQVDPVLTWTSFISKYYVQGIMTNDDDIFVYTNCGATYGSSDYLAILKSSDNGIVYVAEPIPLADSTDSPSDISGSIIYNEPVIWPMK